MVAPPGVNGTGFPTIAAGSDGRAAFEDAYGSEYAMLAEVNRLIHAG